MFFDSVQGLVRVLTVGVLAYVALIGVLRISGKRTLSKMSAFDLVVTVALGSTLATIILSKDVALIEGILAFVLLITLQFMVAWSSVRFPWVERLVKSEPTLLLYDGKPLEQAMRRQRVTLSEIHAAIRAQGIGRIEEVGAVILETDGSFTAIPKSQEALNVIPQP